MPPTKAPVPGSPKSPLADAVMVMPFTLPDDPFVQLETFFAAPSKNPAIPPTAYVPLTFFVLEQEESEPEVYPTIPPVLASPVIVLLLVKPEMFWVVYPKNPPV